MNVVSISVLIVTSCSCSYTECNSVVTYVAFNDIQAHVQGWLWCHIWKEMFVLLRVLHTPGSVLLMIPNPKYGFKEQCDLEVVINSIKVCYDRASLVKLRMRDTVIARRIGILVCACAQRGVQAPPTPAQTAPTAPDQHPLWISIDDTPILLIGREENEAACTKDCRKTDLVYSYREEISSAVEINFIEKLTYWHGALRVSVQLHGTCLYLGISVNTSRNNVPVRALLFELVGNPDDNWWF